VSISAVVAFLAAVSGPVELPSLDVARDSLRQGRGTIGPLSLASVQAHWDVAIGSTRLLVLAGNLDGAIIVFDESGKCLGVTSVHEPISLELADLDFDGRPEVITDELTGRGTGVLERLFNIYQVETKGTINRVWSGMSYSYAPNQERRGYLRLRSRFEGPLAVPGYAVEHLVIDERTGGATTDVFQVANGVMRAVPDAASDVRVR
jgi:hypothetical protein